MKTPDKTIRQSDLLKMPGFCFNTNLDIESFNITTKIRKNSTPLSYFFEVKAGMKVRKDFVGSSKSDSRFHKFILGSSIKPFVISWDNKYVCYDKKLESKFSNQAFRDENIFLAPQKLLVRQVMGKERIYATIDRDNYYVDQSVYLILPEQTISLEYILGLICSKLMSYYFFNTISDRKQLFPKIKGVQIEQLPIRQISDSTTSDKKLHDKLVNNVIALIELNQNISLAKSDYDKTTYARKIDSTERLIDETTYELYGLTKEEIKIVEEYK